MPDFANGIVHEGKGNTRFAALDDLIDKIPEELARPLSIHRHSRVYYSPESEWTDDRCVEIDGHCPARDEWRQRHEAWVRSKQIGTTYVEPQVYNTKTQEEMEIQGKIIQVLPLQEGVGRDGNPWKVQQYILETQEQYPKKVCFDLIGEERINNNPAAVGALVKVSFDIESREFNARWYTSIRAWKVEKQAA